MENQETSPKLAGLLKLLLWEQQELDKKKVKFPHMTDLGTGQIDPSTWCLDLNSVQPTKLTFVILLSGNFICMRCWPACKFAVFFMFSYVLSFCSFVRLYIGSWWLQLTHVVAFCVKVLIVASFGEIVLKRYCCRALVLASVSELGE